MSSVGGGSTRGWPGRPPLPALEVALRAIHNLAKNNKIKCNNKHYLYYVIGVFPCSTRKSSALAQLEPTDNPSSGSIWLICVKREGRGTTWPHPYIGGPLTFLRFISDRILNDL